MPVSRYSVLIPSERWDEDIQNAKDFFFFQVKLKFKWQELEREGQTDYSGRLGQCRDMKGLQFCGPEFSFNKDTFMPAWKL